MLKKCVQGYTVRAHGRRFDLPLLNSSAEITTKRTSGSIKKVIALVAG